MLLSPQILALHCVSELCTSVWATARFKDKVGKQWPSPPEAAPSCPLLWVPPSSVLCQDTQHGSLAKLACPDASP